MATFTLLIASIGILVLASIFNPNFISQQNNSVQIGNATTFSYQNQITNSTACQEAAASGSLVVPGNTFLSQLSFKLDAFWGQVLQDILGIPPTPASQCIQQQNAKLTIFAFNPYDPNSALSFVGVLAVIITVAVISGINIVSSGLNAGSVYILALGTGFILIYLSLIQTAIPTFTGLNFTVNNEGYPIGSTILMLTSLSYAVASLSILNGLKAD